MSERDTQNGDVVMLKLEANVGKPVGIELDMDPSELKGKRVFDNSAEPIRPVLVTDTGLWMQPRIPGDAYEAYNKYSLDIGFESGRRYVNLVHGGVSRGDAEKLGVVRDLKMLEEGMPGAHDPNSQ